MGSTSSNLKNLSLLGDARGSVKGMRPGVGVLVGLVVGGSVAVLLKRLIIRLEDIFIFFNLNN